MTEQEPLLLPPVKLAVIIDEKVVDIMHTDARFAAMVLSGAVFVDVTPENSQDELKTFVGDSYDSASGIFDYEFAKTI